ncbi:hypothetical protein CB0940_02161 [Cercospora beticola]|uniref:CFEM domain-containing protein n=1 Tax=Cercospora beticola TaxID=122368 RepID=A0A2G5I8J4_CERBT|nr:hypothetical protein CB0940_02161 [Cercospora beticola]PIB00783.1 hypothetical protein CB0940_02161 [Cercospora beticola]WPA97703.1 hypothetical protein RHO25_002314 [Cercospora beticola]CAK1358901.1 unnamed protein product [Cercospora beticola]
MLLRYVAVATALLFTSVGADTLDFELAKRESVAYPPLPTLSTCAQACLTEALPASKCKSSTDQICLCASEAYADAAGECLARSCSVVQGLQTRKYLAITCKEPIRDQGPLTRSVSWVMFALATFGTLARCLSRMRALGGTGYGWDDWTIILGWLVLIPVNGLLHIMVDEGLGQDIWMLRHPNYQISKILKFFYISEWLYVLEVNTIKISILLLYLRMWPADFSWFRKTCLVFMAVLATFTVVAIATLGLGCQPMEYFWLKWDGTHEGYCINQNALIWSNAGFTIGFDVLCIILPLPRLIALGIPTRKKIAVVLTFALGGFVTICSILRLRTLVEWGNATNMTWYYNPIAIWSNVELNLGVLCACMPATAGLLQRCYSKASGKALLTNVRRPVSCEPTPPKDVEQGIEQRSLYELRVQNSNGSPMYHARQLHGSSASLGIHRTHCELDTRPATRKNEMDPEKVVLPGTRYVPPRASISPDSAVDQMISDGYTEFAKIRR